MSFLDSLFGSVSNRRLLREIKELRREGIEQMADLNASVEDLKQAVAGVAARVGELTGPLQAQIAELQSTIQAERDAAATLAAAEDQEDVEQNQALADAQANTDTALANAAAAADSIEAEVTKLNEVAAPEAPAPPA